MPLLKALFPLLITATCALPALAQPQSPESDAQTAPPPVAGAQEDTAADSDAAADEGAAPLLDEYEASEQISEDLSVSFPVDI